MMEIIYLYTHVVTFLAINWTTNEGIFMYTTGWRWSLYGCGSNKCTNIHSAQTPATSQLYKSLLWTMFCCVICWALCFSLKIFELELGFKMYESKRPERKKWENIFVLLILNLFFPFVCCWFCCGRAKDEKWQQQATGALLGAAAIIDSRLWVLLLKCTFYWLA